MGLAASAKVLAAGAAWRLTGLDAAGRVLVGTVAEGTEEQQTLAGMLLVQAGNRSVALVAGTLASGAAAPQLVDVLASIGTDAARAALADVASSSPPEIAASAEKALRDLDAIRRHEG
jgi:hypothetical protein